MQLEMLDLHFPKDHRGGNSIRDNWVADMTHFVENFEAPEGKFDTEELLIYKVDEDNYIQGYADLIRHDDNGGQSILDWKTSSMYDKQGFLEHGRQLIIYALAKEQMGIKINEIAWIFLKYVTVKFMGKKRSNSKTKTEIIKHINRRKIVLELEDYLRSDFHEAGYDITETELYIAEALKTNSLDNLPEDIKKNYNIEPCIIKHELTDETRNECKQYINDTIREFVGLDKGNITDWEPREFYRVTRYGLQEDTFFCSSLCDYRYSCEHFQELKKKRMELVNG